MSNKDDLIEMIVEAVYPERVLPGEAAQRGVILAYIEDEYGHLLAVHKATGAKVKIEFERFYNKGEERATVRLMHRLDEDNSIGRLDSVSYCNAMRYNKADEKTYKARLLLETRLGVLTKSEIVKTFKLDLVQMVIGGLSDEEKQRVREAFA